MFIKIKAIVYMANIIKAVRNNNIEEVRGLLISTPSLIETWDGDRTLLMVAVAEGNIEMVQTLSHYGANVNKVYGPYYALTMAVERNDFQMVRTLVKLGAKINEQSVLDAVAFIGNVEIFNFLCSNGLVFTLEKGYIALQIASAHGNVDVAQALLARGVPTSGNNEDRPPLIIAIRNGNIDMVNLLVNNENANALYLNMPPLIWAAKDDKSDIVSILLNNGANVNQVYIDHDTTALMWAFQRGHINTANVLLQHGADFISDLDQIYQSNHAEGAMLFLDFINQAGADFNQQNTTGFTTLMWAARTGNINIVNALINIGVNLDAQDNNGKTALLHAAAVGFIDVVKLLLDYHAAFLIKDKAGYDLYGHLCITSLHEVSQLVEDVLNLNLRQYNIAIISEFLYDNSTNPNPTNDRFALKLFEKLNKKDLAIYYTGQFKDQPNFVDAEIVIQKACQAVQANYLTMLGVSTLGTLDHLAKSGKVIKLNDDVESHIFSYLLSKEILDGISHKVPPLNNIINPIQTLTADVAMDHTADLEEVIDAAADLGEILANDVDLPDDVIVDILPPNNENAAEVLEVGGMLWNQGQITEIVAFATPIEYEAWRFGNSEDESPLKKQRLFGEFEANNENDDLANILGIVAHVDAMDIA